MKGGEGIFYLKKAREMEYLHDGLIRDGITKYPDVARANPTELAKILINEHKLVNKDGEELGTKFFSEKIRAILSVFEDGTLKELSRSYAGEQRAKDLLRIKNKNIREGARVNNALEAYIEELGKVIKNHTFKPNLKTFKNKAGSVGIVHITDLHFNELIEAFFNEYNFEVASRQLKYYVAETVDYFKMKGVTNIVMAATGDLVNSDRRLDELLAMATNRANACFVATYIIEQMLLEYNQYFNVSYVSITGNESRMTQDIHWGDLSVSDNYDVMIHNILSYKYRDSDAINIVSCHHLEQVIEVAGQNILLLHGHQIKNQKNLDKEVQSIIGKYSTQGIRIRMILLGHIHSTHIGDFAARGGSPSGGNDYSFYGLQLASRASQNYHLVYENGNINSMKVDLTTIPEMEGYDITDVVDLYNAKSASKLLDPKTILKITV